MNNKAPSAESQITDSVLFFNRITVAYQKFTETVLELTNALPAVSPQQLVQRCNALRTQRKKLATLDEQMFAIIDLAGRQMVHEPMIDAHRIALTRANMAANTLAQELRAIKITLQIDQEKGTEPVL